MNSLKITDYMQRQTFGSVTSCREERQLSRGGRPALLAAEDPRPRPPLQLGFTLKDDRAGAFQGARSWKLLPSPGTETGLIKCH